MKLSFLNSAKERLEEAAAFIRYPDKTLNRYNLSAPGGQPAFVIPRTEAAKNHLIDPEEPAAPMSLLTFLACGYRIDEATPEEARQFCDWWKRQEDYFSADTLAEECPEYRARPNPKGRQKGSALEGLV